VLEALAKYRRRRREDHAPPGESPTRSGRFACVPAALLAGMNETDVMFDSDGAHGASRPSSSNRRDSLHPAYSPHALIETRYGTIEID